MALCSVITGSEVQSPASWPQAHPSTRTGAVDARDIDATFGGDFPGYGSGFDVEFGFGFLHLRGALGNRWHEILRSLCIGIDTRNHRTDFHFFTGRNYGLQDACGWRGDLKGCLVGLDFKEYFVLLDPVPRVLEPVSDSDFGYRFAWARDGDLDGHGLPVDSGTCRAVARRKNVYALLAARPDLPFGGADVVSLVVLGPIAAVRICSCS